MPEQFSAAASNRCKVFKVSISTKLCIQDRKLGSKKAEDPKVKDSNYNIRLFQTCNIFEHIAWTSSLFYIQQMRIQSPVKHL